jgi:DNA-binding CsgD family transcriptional regulator
MNLRRRLMKHSDVDQCVNIFAEHPDFILQYGGQRRPLRNTLERLVGTEGFLAFVFEEVTGQRVELLGVGGIAFLNDEFVNEAKKPPYFWIAPTLMHRLLEGESPILSNTEVCRANTLEGLAVFAWPLGFRGEHLLHPEFVNFLMGSFIEELRGYKHKEYLGQATDVEGARASLHGGAVLLTPNGRYSELPRGCEEQLLSKPHLFVVTREQALLQVGSWSSSLFISNLPTIGFSRSEQRLLQEALRGGSDEELAKELKISFSAVKKAWRSIYDRVGRSSIGILPKASDDGDYGERGKGKKHHLLAYIREHPEELRPISFKLLGQAHQNTKAYQKTNQPPRARRRVSRPRSPAYETSIDVDDQ